jgi:CubicO group peptidase (beta-lactamase class C family)
MMPFIASGELAMDTPIRYWLPEFGRFHPDLTMRHLIMHRSGIDDSLVSPDPSRPLHDLPPAPGSFPGKSFLYSAWWNWSVLGVVVEAATGKRVESIVRDGVLSPAGMRASAFITPSYLAGQDRHAATDIMEFAPDASASDWQTLRRTGLGRREPATRICGPLSDLARFYRWIQDTLKEPNELLPESLVREATATDRVMGFCVSMKKFGFGKHCSPRSFGFGGAVGGSNVVVGLAEPDHDFCLAVAVNRIGRDSALALKAIVTAMYEDVLDPVR